MQVLPASRYKSGSQKFNEAILGAGQAIGEGYAKNLADVEKKKKYDLALKDVENIYSDPNLTQEQKFIKAFSAMKEFPDAAKQLASGMERFYETPLQKAQTKKINAEAEALIKEEEVEPELQKELKKNSAQWSNETIDKLRAYKGKDPNKKTLAQQAENEFKKRNQKTEGQKFLEKEVAKGYMEAKQDLPKLMGVKGNINRLLELGQKELSGFGGFVKSTFKTGSAAEYETLGASLLEPIIKIFNPVGAVPTAKLNWIKDTFSPKPGELRSTQEGKLATIQRLTDQAEQRALQKIKLYDDFNGNPPESEVMKFDIETSNIINSFVDNQQYLNQLKKEVPEGKILMLDPQGKPLHVDPNQQGPDGKSIVDYFTSLGAKKV